jgi:hypothetical protein
LGRPRISVITRCIVSHTSRIGDGKLTRTRNSLQSQFFMIISPIFCLLSHSRLQLYHHLKKWS